MLKNLLYLEALAAGAFLLFYVALAPRMRPLVSFGPGLAFVLTSAACFLLPSLLLLHLALAAIIALVPRKREEVGLALLVALMATPSLTSRLTVGGLWLVDYGLHHSLALGAWAALLARGGGTRLRWRAHAPFLVFLVLLAFMDARGASASGWARQAVALLLTYALPYWIVARSALDASDLRKPILWVAAGGVMLAAIAAFEMLTKWPLYLVLDQYFGIDSTGTVVKVRFGLLRAEGPMGEQTALGFILVIGAIAALVAARCFANRAAYVAILLIVALGLFAPQSRGAWVGVAAALLALGLYAPSGRSGMRTLLALALALPLILLAVGYGGENKETAGGLDYRDRLWVRGIEEVWKNPWFGTGGSDVLRSLADLRQGEGIVDLVNSYLFVALFAGAIGLAAFAFSLAHPIGTIWKARRRLERSGGERDLAAFSFAVMTAAAVMIAFTSLLPKPMLFVYFAAAFAGIVARGRAGVPAASPRPRAGRAPGDMPAIGGVSEVGPEARARRSF